MSEILKEIRNIKSQKAQLRQFGLVVGIALGILGAILLFKGKNYYLPIYFSFALLFCGLLKPELLKPIQKVWMSLAVVIGLVMTRVILTLLYCLAVVPTAFIAKLCRKQFLDEHIDKQEKSYWILNKNSVSSKEEYENQY